MKKIHFTQLAPEPIGPYSQAVESNGFIFVSGQIALPHHTESPVDQQALQVLKNLETILINAGMTMGNIVKTTIFLTDMAHFPVVNEVYSKFFGSQPPARSTIAVSGLPKGVLVEIEAIASRN